MMLGIMAMFVAPFGMLVSEVGNARELRVFR